jgi:hypothetical protein
MATYRQPLTGTDPLPKITVLYHKDKKRLSIKVAKNSTKTSINHPSSNIGSGLIKMTVFQNNFQGKIIKYSGKAFKPVTSKAPKADLSNHPQSNTNKRRNK